MEFLDGLQLLSGGDTISLTIGPNQSDGKDRKLSFSTNSKSHITFYGSATFSRTVTNVLKHELEAMIAKILKDSHPHFQTVEVDISDTNSSNRINVNFPKSKMTVWLDTFVLYDFLKSIKDFKFVFDSKEKKNFGFSSSEYHNKFLRLKTENNKFDFIISYSNEIYYYDGKYNTHIYVDPEVGTQITHSTENVIVTFLENNQISVSPLTLEDIAKGKNVETKETKKQLKYLFVQEDILTTDFENCAIKQAISQYGIDRTITNYGKMCWIDEVTGKKIQLTLDNFTFFDEKTQRNIEIYKGRIHPQDRVARITFYSSIKDKYSDMIKEVDFVLREDMQDDIKKIPDDEYTDYITGKKFEIKDGTVIRFKEEKKYWIIHSVCIKENLNYINQNNKKSKNYLVQLSRRQLGELNDNNEVVKTNIETGFTFVDENTKHTYTFTEKGFNVITN